MRSAFAIILSICILPTGYAQQPVRFDEWGDIQFSDEKARLDNAALAVQKQMPRNIIYLVIHAGKRGCVGEARARGIRAKKHLASRGIAPAQVIWIDGGHQQKLRTEVWIWPPEIGEPSVFPEYNLKPSEVVARNCKIKRRRSV
jgi:hypothetical protein